MGSVEKYIDYKKIREIRLRTGKSGSEISRKLGISEHTVIHVENGQHLTGIKNLIGIIKEIDADMLEILEIIKLCPVSKSTLRKFRNICKAEKRTPDEVITTMIEVFCDLNQGECE